MSKDTITSVSRALDILTLFMRFKKELGVSEISEELGIYKSTVHRLLHTLKQKGFVYQNPESGKYWLGVRNFSLGMLYEDQLTLKDMAYPYLKQLADEWKETVHLAVLDSSDKPEVIVIQKVETDHYLTISPPKGSRTPAHCSGVGKALLAYLSKEELSKLFDLSLKKFTPNTITDPDRLIPELEDVRARGYAIDQEELELGLSCIGVPVFREQDQVVAAISISGPTTRISPQKHSEIIYSLKHMSSELSKHL